MKSLLKKIIPEFVFDYYHLSLALLSAWRYGFPSKKMTVIGITGTKGKSTAVVLAGKILEKAGHKVGWISSLTIKIGSQEWLNPYHMTMPGKFLTQKLLTKMAKQGCTHILIEVTSEGIKQFRHKFIDFNIAGFTNLAPEHLEAHGGFENYRKTKLKLFKKVAKQKTGIGVYNLDDQNVKYFLQPAISKKYGYSLDPEPKSNIKQVDYLLKITDYKLSSQGIEFLANNLKFNTPLLGKFNLHNAAFAICLAMSQNVDMKTIKQTLREIKTIPGRVEFIDQGQEFKVIVDLAHTPDSFEKIFKLAKNLFKNQRIISVFGSAGGGRDKWKRPELGKIADKYSNLVILTNEDPYDEKPEKILEDIQQGMKGYSEVEQITDRRSAIRKALKSAKSNDVVLVLGKGTEQTLVAGSHKQSWDDRKVAREELQKLYE